MTHLLGTYLPPKKRVDIALTQFYGIGLTRSKAIINFLKIDPKLKVKNLTKAELTKISYLIKNSFFVNEELKRFKSLIIKRLIEIKSYKGLRHIKGLPLRGQRTSTNGKTQKSLASKHRRGS